MKRITVEEHFVTEEYLARLGALLSGDYPSQQVIEEEKNLDDEVRWFPGSARPIRDATTRVQKLLDMGEGRIAAMTEGGIDVQVLSLVAPGVQVFEAADGTRLARQVNDRLAEAVSRYPQRLVGLAALAPQDPDGAAKELERAVRELGLKGASLNSHTKGEYLDDRKYWGLLQRAAELHAPIYIHPRRPSPAMLSPYLTYPELSGPMCGFAAEVSLHALRLICSGVFDQFPDLTFMLGHLGEGLPFWLWRLDNHWQRTPLRQKLQNPPSYYIKHNFFFTTSGMFWGPALAFCCATVGADRLLFAVDYPMESNQEGASFMEAASVSRAEKEQIYHRNAEALFQLT